MASLQNALVNANLVSPEAAKAADRFWSAPAAIRPLLARFAELKDRWSRLPGETKLMLTLDLATSHTVAQREQSLRRAIEALESVPE